MRRSAAVVALALALCTGCARVGRYAKDRGNDFLGCFKLQGGYGFPADVEMQATDWLATGAGVAMSKRWGLEGRRLREGDDFHAGLPVVPTVYWLSSERSPLDDAGLRAFCTDHSIREFFWFGDSEHGRETGSILVLNLCRVLDCGRNPDRKLIDAFDVDVAATLLLSARVGFSPGQFLDFAAGLATFDLAGDDSEGK